MKRLTVVYEVPDTYDVSRITGTGDLEVVKCSWSDAMRERDEARQQLAESRARIATLEGHLDWIGWSSDGVERCRQQLAEAQAAAKEALECFDIVTQNDALANMTVALLRVELINRHPWLDEATEEGRSDGKRVCA